MQRSLTANMSVHLGKPMEPERPFQIPSALVVDGTMKGRKEKTWTCA